MPTLSLHRFYFDAIQLAVVNKGWRYGQAMFNHLADVRTDLSEQVRGTDKDPFHVQSLSDPRWDKFVAFIEANWTPTEHVEKTDLIKVKELLLKNKQPYQTDKSGSPFRDVKTYLTMETLVSRSKVVFQFSAGDELVGIETQ